MKRALNPFAGRWAIPGGFMEKGETVEQAACRELREETCLILDPDELAIYGVMSIPAINEVYISLIAPLPSMAFGCTPEASDIRLLSQAELARYERAYAPTTDMLIRDLYGNLIGGTIGCHAAVLMGVNGASSYSRRGKLRT
jgi:ADP-ribose pyrophosphatase YjhB (NUDIX family)